MRDAVGDGEVEGGTIRAGLAAGDDAVEGHVRVCDLLGSSTAAQGDPGGKVRAVVSVLQQTWAAGPSSAKYQHRMPGEVSAGTPTISRTADRQPKL